MKTILITALAFLFAASSSMGLDLMSVPVTDSDWNEFLDVLSQVESNGRPGMVKLDVNKKTSYGCLQIQQAYLIDSGLNYQVADLLTKEVSYAVAKAYLKRYGGEYVRKTGKLATFEILARIHNGGPSGWKKSTTEAYVSKVRKHLHLVSDWR